jgi:LysR family transcriptional regulator, cyn operon transcriptional activator
MAHLNLSRIRSFVIAADESSLSRAAAVIHLTQPALSKQIHLLEEELGVRLFDRVGGGVQLTSAGRDLLERGRLLLLQAESLAERARVLEGGATGVLKVGATSMSLESFLAPFIPAYRGRWPGVDVSITEDGGMRLLRQVEHGELDVAITGPRAPELHHQLLFPVRVVAVMLTDHRLARRRTASLRDLVSEPLLGLRREFTTRQMFDAACQTSCLEPRFVFETSVPSALLAMARIGYGVALMPSNQLVKDRRLRRVPIIHDGKSLGQWMAVSWHGGRQLAPYAEAFIAELAARTKQGYPGREFSYAPPVPELNVLEALQSHEEVDK